MSKRLGVILVNLGTPEQPTPASVRRFLQVFLSDKRVVEIPSIIWKPILFGFILPFRPKSVAQAYASIWTDRGSPLKAITEDQIAGLRQLLLNQYGEKSPLVEYAMTYGRPGLESAVDSLTEQGATRFLVLPLYPQYSATTTGAVYDQVAKLIQSRRNVPQVLVHKQYCERDDYISALANSIDRFQQNNGTPEKLLFSFHGIPKRCVDLGDPYYEQCMATAAATAKRLQLSDEQWQVSFQSRLGKAEWLKPYTSELLQEWGKTGVKDVQVVCPAFAADCLETLEEIRVENRDVFIEAGGQSYEMIPCLNSDAEHLQVMANIVDGYQALD